MEFNQFLPPLVLCAFWLGIWIGRKTKSKSGIEIAYQEAKRTGAEQLVVHLKR